MSSGQRPLFAEDRSEVSRTAEEEDALLTGQPTGKNNDRTRKWIQIGTWSWASISTIVVIILAIAYSKEKAAAAQRKTPVCWQDQLLGKKNMIFMVSDGMGPASLELARSFRQYRDGLPWDDVLTLDKNLVGTSRTRSSNSWITDSAAGATAFSCGKKSYNNAISVLPDQSPCGTILEAAKKAGYMTGLVVTTRITDATPACFASHVKTRFYEDLIAEQMLGYYPLGRVVDVMIGGGRCHFLPNTTASSCRADDKDLVGRAKEDGWTYVDNKKDLMNLDPAGGIKLPLLALMADYDIPYEIDRQHVDDVYPSQYEMATLALETLKAATQGNTKGFFIMIEGSRIDHAGHHNDPAAQVHETLMHDKTFAAALDFVEKDSTPGLVMSTSDHETGGLSTALQINITQYPEYIWYPSVLANATASASNLGTQWSTYIASSAGQKATKVEQSAFVAKLISKGLGFQPTAAQIATVVNHDPPIDYTYLFSHMISRRAEIGWSTFGHSAVDVNIYGSDPSFMKSVIGNVENTDVGNFMATFLDLDLKAVTEELVKKDVQTSPQVETSNEANEERFAWMGPKIEEGGRMMASDGLHDGLKH